MMNDAQRPAVETIITRFRAQLDKDVLDSISNAQFSELARMIEGAIDDEVASTVDRIDEVVRKLRTGVHRTELEL